MADLDFRHQVQSRQSGDAPSAYKGEGVRHDISAVPDFQSPMNNYAAATNWMSSIGSAVAIRASNAVAQKIGGNLGQNPQGDLGPVMTDFDKVMQDSYRTQAQATLGLQANKLITDSNLEMAKAPRITSDLIASTNKQVSLGLQNIFKNAPAEIRPHLEYQYGSQQLNQASDLTERMIREQKEDRKANTAYASQVNAESAHALAMNGNYDAAMAAVDATREANEADVAAGISTPIMAKSNTDAARQSALSGKYSHEYESARAQGKGEEFLRELADNKPSDISDADYPVVVSHVMQHINQQQVLRRQDQALSMAKFNVSLAEDPLGISNAQIAELNSHLDPIQQQEASLAYVKAIKSIQRKSDGIEKALASYTDINEFPKQSSDNKNGAWESTYKAMLQRPEAVATGMTEDSAKLYSAAAAPVAIPGFITELNAKASTADPISLESAGQAVNYMRSHNLGQNLTGLGAEQESMLEVYGQLRQTMEPVEAAQKAHETVYNKSKEQKEANKEALADYYKTQRSINPKFSEFGLVGKLVGQASNLVIRNLPGYNNKANKVFETYFNTTNGDEATALKLTKQYMDTQYGQSVVNGKPELMYQPVENIPGVPHDAQGPIQSDIVEQANTKFQQDKQLFDQGKLPYWYEARQKISADEALTSKRVIDSIHQNRLDNPLTEVVLNVHNLGAEYKKHSAILKEYRNGQPITIVKHNKSGKDEVFEGAIQANPWGVSTGNPAQPISGGYDMMIKTENGMKNIPMMNPLNSNIQYNPRVDYIKNLYSNTIGLSTLQYMFHNAPKGTLGAAVFGDEPPKGLFNRQSENSR